MSATGSAVTKIKGGVTAALGFRASGVKAGIKKSGGYDMGLIVSDFPATGAGCFTTNKVRAFCVDWCASLLPSSNIRAMLMNSGNANACTGKAGEDDARKLAYETAKLLGCKDTNILMASTGVIGHRMPLAPMIKALPALCKELSDTGGARFATTIMTTDTVSKECALTTTISRKKVTIGGCCKGAGMISPSMATMLAFITTDAVIDPKILSACVKNVVDRTFNNLTIDGDTSTNDMVQVMANGASGAKVTSKSEIARFEDALFEVCNDLCARIAADGEGATKRIEIRISGGKTFADAQKVARSIANSNLVKCAMFGNDPNWGRILCAIGYSGGSFSREKLSVKLCGIPVCAGTTPVAFPIKKMIGLLKKKIVIVEADLGQGKSAAIAHTCDFSYDYVKINAEYHT